MLKSISATSIGCGPTISSACAALRASTCCQSGWSSASALPGDDARQLAVVDDQYGNRHFLLRGCRWPKE
jgi:hypothetical protein